MTDEEKDIRTEIMKVKAHLDMLYRRRINRWSQRKFRCAPETRSMFLKWADSKKVYEGPLDWTPAHTDVATSFAEMYYLKQREKETT